jgi:hypothetical protein
MQSALKPVPGRECGSCMMCCKLPLIEELEKPAGKWCRHAAIGKGCSIYENRPLVCQSFFCQWMLDARLGPEWKPDKAKLVLYRSREGQEVFYVAVDPAAADAWTKPPFFAAIKGWVLEGAELGRLVLVYVGARWNAVLPDRVVELGRIEQSFVLERERGPTGKTIDVRIVPRPSPQPAAPPGLPGNGDGAPDETLETG